MVDGLVETKISANSETDHFMMPDETIVMQIDNFVLSSLSLS